MTEPANDTTPAAQPATFLQHLAAEIDHLTQGDKPDRAKAFSALIRASVQSWQLLAEEKHSTHAWRLIEAKVARVDACERHGSEEHRLKLQPLIRELHELIRQSDIDWLRACPRRRTLCRRFAEPFQINKLASGEGLRHS